MQAKEGVACTGFVTKVAPFGLHVSLYGNVFGLLPAKALTKHGIQDPAEAFTVGQVCWLPDYLSCVIYLFSKAHVLLLLLLLLVFMYEIPLPDVNGDISRKTKIPGGGRKRTFRRS